MWVKELINLMDNTECVSVEFGPFRPDLPEVFVGSVFYAKLLMKETRSFLQGLKVTKVFSNTYEKWITIIVEPKEE